MSQDNERELRRLARRAKGTLQSVDVTDLAAVYRAVGLPATNVMTTGEPAKIFSDKIEQALLWDDRASAVELDELERHLVLRWLADRAVSTELVILVDTIKDASRMGAHAWQAPPFSEEARWVTALAAAKDYNRVYQRPPGYTPFINPRHRNVAEAIKRLRAEGIGVEVHEGRADFTKTERKKVGLLIAQGVRDLGGFDFADFLFRRMTNLFDEKQKRHHSVRRVSTSGRNGEPTTPTGYLLQLAAKYATVPPDRTKISDQYAQRILEIATSFADALDIRSVSAFDGMFKDQRTIVPYLREIVLFDATYTLVQTRPSDVPRLLRQLFDWVPAGQILPRAGCTVEDFVKVVEAVSKVSDFRGPGVLSRAQVTSALSSAEPTIEIGRVLDACSHEPETVNVGYTFPTEQTETTCWSKPFIKDGPEYLMMDPSWCAPAFYEVLLAELRDLGGFNVDHEVGYAIERLVQNELGTRGVTLASGEYEAAGQKAECDVLVETSDRIILIETKKKVLRRASKGGDAVPLLVDLADALFAAQLQAARHELALYRDGKLVLDDGRQKHTILRGDREVERIALTHLDYGSLQDRQVLSNVLRIIAGANVRSDDPQAHEALSKLERKGRQLVDVHNKLAGYRQTGANPFFNCWFLSVGHLMVMLDHVSSNDSLWQQLRQTRSATMGSLDFYFEYAEMRKIREAS